MTRLVKCIMTLAWIMVLAARPVGAASNCGDPGADELDLKPALPKILSMRERAEVRDRWLTQRLDTIVPALMNETDTDMWVLIAREYNEDPVVSTMLPATWISARRRTILVFTRRGDRVERTAIARYPVGDVFPSAWDPEIEPDQWKRLVGMIEDRDPRTIAITHSNVNALADGTSHSEFMAFQNALPDPYKNRIVPADDLAIGWLETRMPEEADRYREIVRIAHAIIGEAFSDTVITPGQTTTDDVRWWMRDRVAELGLRVWFHPSVTIDRAENAINTPNLAVLSGDKVIERGDLLHVDFGIVYLGLATDTQHHAYVLRQGERDAPDGLKEGLRAANRVQDHLTSSFEDGVSGNMVLGRARAASISEGLEPTIYSHPIGYHGHGAGPSIGFWDNQSLDKPEGNRPVRAMTAWSIELNAAHRVPEWGGQRVLFKVEEDAFFDGNEIWYLNGRQTRFHLIGQ